MRAAPRIGTVISLPEVALAELLGYGLDLAWIDLEHAALGVGDVPGLAIGLRASTCAAHVRLPDAASMALAPVLDAGVDGVVAPDVRSAQQAEAFVRRLSYPPRGVRGFGPRRAGGYGRATAGLTPEPPVCTVQIESREGVAAAGEIAAVEGVDALVVGCSDLSRALDHPDVELAPAIAMVERAARDAGIEFGLAGGGNPRALASLAPPGIDQLIHSVDVRLYARAVDEATATLLEALVDREVTS